MECYEDLSTLYLRHIYLYLLIFYERLTFFFDTFDFTNFPINTRYIYTYFKGFSKTVF